MAITNRFTDIAVAIREKTGKSAMLRPADMPAEIRSISGGGGGGWQPPADWWDIKTMVDTGVLEWSGESVANVRYGYVVSDGHPTTKLVAGYEYYLSDGSYYNGAATHTWNRSQDKPCSEGYMTRAVIVVKAANRDVAISQRSIALDGIASLFIYLGDCNLTSIVCGHLTAASANRSLCAVLHSNLITIVSTAIGADAFRSCYALTSIIIPQGMTSLNNSTFNNCRALTSITIPQGVTSIGAGAFNNCYALASITIPQGVTSIGATVFNYCYALTSITIPQDVTSIGAAAFSDCYSLTSITIPQGVTSIAANAFNNCYALAAFSVPVGFNLSVTLSASSLLSVSSLEQLIDNAADMTGQTAITFTLGATNLAKLSDDYKALAAAKNITLA